jgi:hypothetical protein
MRGCPTRRANPFPLPISLESLPETRRRYKSPYSPTHLLSEFLLSEQARKLSFLRRQKNA